MLYHFIALPTNEGTLPLLNQVWSYVLFQIRCSPPSPSWIFSGFPGVWLIRWCKSSFQLSVESNCDYTGFALPCSVIGLENYCHSLNHSNVETKPKTRSLTFSLTSGSLHVFTTCSRCLPVIFCFPMIGGCDYFGFGGTKLDWKALCWGGELGWKLKVKTRTVNKENSKWSNLTVLR